MVLAGLPENALVQSVEERWHPPVGLAEEGKGGRNTYQVEKSHIKGDGDDETDAELLDDEKITCRESNEHDDEQRRSGRDEAARGAHAGADSCRRRLALATCVEDHGEKKHFVVGR